jgi:hypothetical protein
VKSAGIAVFAKPVAAADLLGAGMTRADDGCQVFSAG